LLQLDNNQINMGDLEVILWKLCDLSKEELIKIKEDIENILNQNEDER